MKARKHYLTDGLMFLSSHRLTVGLGLVMLSSLLAWMHYLLFRDLGKISNYFFLHLAFLPMHALILGVFLEELIALREKFHRRRKLHLYLGIFFRRLGTDAIAAMFATCKNSNELADIITVERDWKHRRFVKAIAELDCFRPSISYEAEDLSRLMSLVIGQEEQLATMIQNPLMLEFEDLYHCLVAMEHLVEETEFHGEVSHMNKGARAHLARDAGKAMIMLLKLWLGYLEFLKREHPVLFSYQVGLHSTIQPIILDEAA